MITDTVSFAKEMQQLPSFCLIIVTPVLYLYNTIAFVSCVVLYLLNDSIGSKKTFTNDTVNYCYFIVDGDRRREDVYLGAGAGSAQGDRHLYA